MGKRIFLGGTCNNSTWRKDIIGMIDIDYFNPVVDDWTEDCMLEERRQRQICDYVLYTITPRMTGVYSIAEVVDDSNKRPERTIFCLINFDKDDHKMPIRFTPSQLKSLEQVGEMVKRNGGQYFTSLEDVANFVNHK